MSTHVDGAPPSVSPDPDDGEPDRQSSGLDDGSQWVRAEIARRMAENRSTRGRHARRGDAAANDAAERDGREGPRREPVTPVSPPQTVPLPPPGFVAAGDLPENYVPRHSVQTPGPAAEPAAPISGPIPIVRPVAADAAAPGPAEPRGPVGGPSLPPTGMPLPARRKRGGPGTPLQNGAGTAPAAWSRPGGSIVPSSEPVQKLGAPPGPLGGADPLPSWGVPTSPPRGFAAAPVPVAPRPAPTAGAGDGPDGGPDAEAGAAQEATATAAEQGVEEAVGEAGAEAADEPTPAEAVDRVAAAEPEAEANRTADAAEAAEAAEADADAPADPASDVPDKPDGSDTPAAPRTGDPAVPAAHGAGEPSAPAVDDASEAATTVLPVIDGGVPPPARLVGISVQRPGAARTVTLRAVTPRNIPVVGTAPPEPGSTRVRVVLSERKGVARPVRTIKEVQEGTAVGELLRRDLIRSQLLVTLRFGALAVLVLGTLPAILTLLPAVGQSDVLGLRMPWLLLGVLMYPFLVGVAWRYTRVADRVEQNFADHVQD